MNKNIIISSMEIDHIDQVLIVENLSFKIPWSKKAFEEELVKNELAIYLVADVDDRIIGYAGMWKVVDEGHITNIAVHPELRNCGVGSALLEGLIGKAVENKITKMTLEVRKSNISAISLYSKYGFLDGGFRKAYYADNNEDALIMWKENI